MNDVDRINLLKDSNLEKVKLCKHLIEFYIFGDNPCDSNADKSDYEIAWGIVQDYLRHMNISLNEKEIRAVKAWLRWGKNYGACDEK
jgi:hypothetical protein